MHGYHVEIFAFVCFVVSWNSVAIFKFGQLLTLMECCVKLTAYFSVTFDWRFFFIFVSYLHDRCKSLLLLLSLFFSVLFTVAVTILVIRCTVRYWHLELSARLMWKSYPAYEVWFHRLFNFSWQSDYALVFFVVVLNYWVIYLFQIFFTLILVYGSQVRVALHCWAFHVKPLALNSLIFSIQFIFMYFVFFAFIGTLLRHHFSFAWFFNSF